MIINTLKAMFAKSYRTINHAQARAALDEGAILLDVREPAEWRSGHAPAARHIPLGQLSNRIGDLPADREIITVCRSGMRSAQAAKLLSAHQLRVSNLRGGMNAWAAAGLPVVGKNGRPGHIG